MALKPKPLLASTPRTGQGDPGPVLAWFANRQPIPLTAPPKFREYGPLSDDPEKTELKFPIVAVEGVAFAIEYLDLRGWLSTRTIRCVALDASRPVHLKAYCNVRRTTRTFRLDRIVSTTNLRTGETAEAGPMLLLAPHFLPGEPSCTAFLDFQKTLRNDVFVLLAVSMAQGRLTADARRLLLDYVTGEAARLNQPLPPMPLVELWLDNLSPAPDSILTAVRDLLADREAFVRLLPRMLEISRAAGPDNGAGDEALRDLISALRLCYCPKPVSAPVDFVPRR